MARLFLALTLLLALPGALAAQADSVRADSARADSVRADSLRADSLAADSLAPDSLAPDSLAAPPAGPATPIDTATATDPGVRLRFAREPMGLRVPPMLRLPGFGAPRRLPVLQLAAWDSALERTLDSARAERAVGRRVRLLYGTTYAEAAELDSLGLGEQGTPDQRRGVLGLDRKYVDLVVEGQATLEIRTDRFRNERCTPLELLDPNAGCRGGFKAPRLENRFDVRTGGLIGQRLHVNIDYDSEREFDANNNLQVYYQGLEDEIVRRVEVGTVTFRPPRSRFLTAAIPSNNFGVNASFQLGAVEVQALAATQKGSVVGERTYTIGQSVTQTQDRQVRDLDFESGRFFWVVDPTTVPGYPAVDILASDRLQVPETQRPAQVRVYRYRATGGTGVDPNLGGIPALAFRPDGDQKYGPVRWQLLVQGTDYYLDESGLWIALTTKLDRNDYLAVSYVTGTADTVGTFPSVETPGRSDSLLLVVDPSRQEATWPTFKHEMRQVYRVSGADLDPSTLEVSVQLNRSERPSGGAATYLELLGLAEPTDAYTFDRTNHLFPGPRDPGADQALRDAFVVFPHLQPFADGQRLPPAERQDSLYRTPLYLLFTQGPAAKFDVRLRYVSAGGGDRSTLNLNALQIREGSEELRVGGRVLERGTDYTIQYETGIVSFTDPDLLFGTTGTATVTARFEERGVFAVAPTTILGMVTRYNLGDYGAINLVGMYQSEGTAFNRPPLGFESSTHLVGGLNTELRFRPNAVTRFLNALTSTPATAPSQLEINAELAFTRPDPNRSGQAYLEEFEGDQGVQVSLAERNWEFGSVPQRADGLEDIGFTAGFDSASAVQLTWQNLVPACSGCNQAVELRPQDIDTLIRISSRGEALERLLFVTLHPDTAGGQVDSRGIQRWTLPARPGAPRWRSVVTPLSSTGMDLSRNEYLEFYVFEGGEGSAQETGTRLVLDLGTVNEDALAIAPLRFEVNGADTVFSGRQYPGVGRLDSERGSDGIFNAQTDDLGILADRPDSLLFGVDATVTDVALCQRTLTGTVTVYVWGDLRSRCTRGNGEMDTEDLNGDNVLNAAGANDDVYRWVVNLADPKYFVRDGVSYNNADGTVSKWRLFRVPLRQPDATLGSPNLRLVQQLRMTVAAAPDLGTDVASRFALARMRFVGSPWVRRADRPIAGLDGSTAEPLGEVVVSVVSTENVELGYEPPPGVFDVRERRDGSLDQLGVQINERSLRVIARELNVGSRAEGYLRFPGGTQNLLNYREMRVWFRGRGPGWDEGELQAFVKLGSDDRNFYLYRAGAKTGSWEPEARIDLEVWRRLRAEVEQRWLAGEAPSGGAECGAAEDAYVACEGPYLVQVGSPGISPPNLAAVQEISAGIYRATGTASLAETELWVDDIRLTQPVAETGKAMAFDSRLVASDVGDVTVSFARQDGQFRQIGQTPTYETTNALQLRSNLRMERFLPASLGLAIPVGITYSRTGSDPQLLRGTDLRGSAINGLRRPRAWSTTWSVGIRRSVRGSNWLTRGLLDPFSLTATMTRGESDAELSTSEARSRNIQATYNLQLQPGGFGLGLGGLVDLLPGFLRNSEGGDRLRTAKLNLAPTSVRFGSGLRRDESELQSFQRPIVSPGDSLLPTTRQLTHVWRNNAGVTWQPLGMLVLNADLTSTRDLRRYSDSTSLGRLVSQSRRSFLGTDVGVERDRSLSTTLALTPRLTSWLRPRFTTSSGFVLSRSLTSRQPVREGEDSTGAFILPQTLNNSRANEVGVALELARAVSGLFGDSSGVARFFSRVRPLDVSRRQSLSSTWDLAAFDPDLGFQLGFGGLQDFLYRPDGTQALGAQRDRRTAFTSGVDLPVGISATLSYTTTSVRRFQRVGDEFAITDADQEEWPVGSVRWTHTFGGGPITTLAMGTQFRRRKGTAAQLAGGEGGVQSATRSYTVTPDVQVSLRNGMVVTASVSRLDQETLTNGNTTVLDQLNVSGTFNYAFQLPQSISKGRRLIRSSLTLTQTQAETCLERPGVADCQAVSDILRREIRGGFDTDLMRTLSGGLQLGYSLNDAAHLNRRTSQIFVTAAFTLSLFSGDYR